MATPALAPSAMATATSKTSRDASPATKTPETELSSVTGSVTMPPLSSRLQPKDAQVRELLCGLFKPTRPLLPPLRGPKRPDNSIRGSTKRANISLPRSMIYVQGRSQTLKSIP